MGNPHQEKRKGKVYGERKRYLCSSAFHLWMTSRTVTASQEEDVREINCSPILFEAYLHQDWSSYFP